MIGKIILGLALVAVATATDVAQCRSGLPLPVNVDVENCALMPCDIIRGEEARMTVDLIAPSALTQIPIKVVAIFAGIDVPYPLPETDACTGLTTGACPLEEGDAVVWELGFFVDTVFPQVYVEIEFTLENDENVGITCFKIDANVI